MQFSPVLTVVVGLVRSRTQLLFEYEKLHNATIDLTMTLTANKTGAVGINQGHWKYNYQHNYDSPLVVNSKNNGHKYIEPFQRYAYIFEINRPIYLFIMAALRSKWGFCSYGFFFFFFVLSFFSSSPILSRRRLDVYHTSTHDVTLVRI